MTEPYLRAGLFADNGLEVSHDSGERVRADGGSDQVMGVHDVGDPVSHGFVDRVFQRAAAGFNRNHLYFHHVISTRAHVAPVGDLARAYQVFVEKMHVRMTPVRKERYGGDEKITNKY